LPDKPSKKLAKKLTKKPRNASSLPALKYKINVSDKAKLDIFDPDIINNPDQMESKMKKLLDQNSIESDTELASQFSWQSFVANPDARKIALQHIRQKKENIESSQDFVMNSRKILMKGISIHDKLEETRRLEEYILMEKEKLTESKRAFEDDKQRYK